MCLVLFTTLARRQPYITYIRFKTVVIVQRILLLGSVANPHIPLGC